MSADNETCDVFVPPLFTSEEILTMEFRAVSNGFNACLMALGSTASHFNLNVAAVFGSVATRLPNLRDRSGEFCVYKWVASHLSTPEIRIKCQNLSQPVTAVCIFCGNTSFVPEGLPFSKVRKSPSYAHSEHLKGSGNGLPMVALS